MDGTIKPDHQGMAERTKGDVDDHPSLLLFEI